MGERVTVAVQHTAELASVRDAGAAELAAQVSMWQARLQLAGDTHAQALAALEQSRSQQEAAMAEEQLAHQRGLCQLQQEHHAALHELSQLRAAVQAWERPSASSMPSGIHPRPGAGEHARERQAQRAGALISRSSRCGLRR